jgi:hypothetical protein
MRCPIGRGTDACIIGVPGHRDRGDERQGKECRNHELHGHSPLRRRHSPFGPNSHPDTSLRFPKVRRATHRSVIVFEASHWACRGLPTGSFPVSSSFAWTRQTGSTESKVGIALGCICGHPNQRSATACGKSYSSE